MTRTFKSRALRPVDAPHFGYWKALVHAFYDPKLYVDVAKRWKRLSLGYLLLALLVLCLPYSIHLMRIFDTYLKNDLLVSIDRLPVLYVQNGQVSINKPVPYFVRNDKNEVLAIVDTTGQIVSLTYEYPKAVMLITKDKLLFRSPTPPPIFSTFKITERPITTTTFGPQTNAIFNGQSWTHSITVRSLIIFAEFLLYPTMVLVIFTLALMFLLPFAMMAQLVAKGLMKVSLSYTQSFRLLMVAATPQLTALLIVLAIDVIIKGFGLFLSLLLAFYFGFAVLSYKRWAKQMVLS